MAPRRPSTTIRPVAPSNRIILISPLCRNVRQRSASLKTINVRLRTWLSAPVLFLVDRGLTEAASRNIPPTCVIICGFPHRWTELSQEIPWASRRLRTTSFDSPDLARPCGIVPRTAERRHVMYPPQPSLHRG
jgi:hypothetical protein